MNAGQSTAFSLAARSAFAPLLSSPFHPSIHPRHRPSLHPPLRRQAIQRVVGISRRPSPSYAATASLSSISFLPSPFPSPASPTHPSSPHRGSHQGSHSSAREDRIYAHATRTHDAQRQVQALSRPDIWPPWTAARQPARAPLMVLLGG